MRWLRPCRTQGDCATRSTSSGVHVGNVKMCGPPSAPSLVQSASYSISILKPLGGGTETLEETTSLFLQHDSGPCTALAARSYSDSTFIMYSSLHLWHSFLCWCPVWRQEIKLSKCHGRSPRVHPPPLLSLLSFFCLNCLNRSQKSQDAAKHSLTEAPAL